MSRNVSRKAAGRALGALVAVGAMSFSMAAPASAASNAGAGTLDTQPLSGSSTSGNSSISGYYTYNADGTAGGRTKYDGRFDSVTLTDNIDGNGLGAALVLEYDEWVNGAWGHVYPYISRKGRDGTTSWNFNDKANIRVSVCDYNSKGDWVNCKRLV